MSQALGILYVNSLILQMKKMRPRKVQKIDHGPMFTVKYVKKKILSNRF